MLPFEHRQLLAQGEILNQQSLPRAKPANKDADPKPHNSKHGMNC
jgi:hypothetical protein